MTSMPTSPQDNSELVELAELPLVNLGSVARAEHDFAFVLQNVTGDEVTVRLVAQDAEVTLAEEEVTLASRSEHRFFGRLDAANLSLGRQRLRVLVYTSEGVGTVSIHLRIASVALPALLGAAYSVMILMGLVAGSEFLVTLGFAACLIVTVLLWQRLKGWHYPALGLGMALVYLAIQPVISPSEPEPSAPMAPAAAFGAEVVEDGVLLTWRAPAGEDGQANACIVCKRGTTPPASMSDGRSVFMGKVEKGAFRDTCPLETGMVYAYTIFVCEPGNPARFSPPMSTNVLFSPSQKAKAEAPSNRSLPLRLE